MANYEEQSHGFTYDVFISFRGEDTRLNFVGYLCEEFRKRGINAFYDDKNLKIGEELSPAFCKAIKESNISVIVLSKDYASSRWCLDELAKIMECTKRNKKQIAFPIFYHVDPSDVRHQRERYGEAMVAHQKRFGKESEKIKEWRAALSEVADFKGHSIHTGHEIDHVNEIAEKVHANIAPKPLLVGEKPVGLDQRIEEVKSLLDLKPNDDTVCMLGITGLGGIGKTELAKSLYNKIVHQFEAASFLANVREKSNKINGPEDLQKTLLSEMFQQPETELGSTSKGNYEIKHRLERKKILLVLDDVDNMEQLKNLAGGSDWFGPGSRIIITTRDKGLLMGNHPIKVIKTYVMTELNDQLSLELFCRNVFGKSHPNEGYEDLSSRVVGYAKGLPLALKVIGSNLVTRDTLKDWEDALEDYERIPRKGIQDVLKVSYDVLEPYAQSVFLDIACFFKGKRIEYVGNILREFSVASNIVELVNKSLLSVENGYLNMHDLIQDMGREIVRQEAPDNPAKRSRLWFHQDVIDVLSANDSGSDAIQGIMLDPPQHITEVDWNDTAFEKMNRLRILIVRYTTFSSEPNHLPNHLRLLDWDVYPSKTFPPKFCPRNIIILDLPNSQLTMEDPSKQFSYLVVMNFSNNQSITTMSDVSKVEKLRELRLDNCENLTTVHESIGFLKHLVHLSVSGCTKLENFLQKMFLPSLEVLKLDWCEKLEHFPDIENKMNKPLKIHMMGTSIKKLPNSIGNLIGLVSIDMEHSEKLEYLPSSLFRLPNVIAFDFGSCPKLGRSFKRFLPDSPSEANGRSTLKRIHCEESGLSDEDIQAILIHFPKLEELIATCNNFVSLPLFDHLTNLDVRMCKKLQKIPECTSLRILNVDDCTSLTHISTLPYTVQKIDARKCFNFSSETSDMLWDQVKKEKPLIEIVMPGIKVPKWFNYICKDGIPCLWVRGKFPSVALALVFQYVDEKERINPDLVKLHLVINGKPVPHKGDYNFIIEPHHVLVCDLRVLFNHEEWLNLDALLLKHEWNQVQISYEAKNNMVTLSEWGVFVYKQGDVNLKEPSDGFTFTYDVFFSFRGEDTQLNFIAYLRETFQKWGINAFYDDNLRIGEDMSPAFCEGEEEYKISVIVLSEDYAFSTWCLDELVKIMECTEINNKQIVFPIFYHVDPSDVRHQRKSYGEAMVDHQNRFGKDSKNIKAWTAALSKVADLKGHHIDTGHEIDHVNVILKEIAEKIHDESNWPQDMEGSSISGVGSSSSQRHSARLDSQEDDVADSSVSLLLDKLSWLLQEEVNLQKGVREDVQYIKDELERHKAILMVADSLEDKDPELKVWVKSVRNIAQDMEDAIDEYNLRLVDDAIDEYNLRLVDHHQQSHKTSSVHKIAFGLKTMKVRHRIATDIQGIKSKVETISHGRPNISGVGSSSSQRRSSRLDSQADALLLEEADLVGIEQPKKQLCDLLFKDETNRAVISIYGMGGLGKTTLAKQVYDDPKVKKHFRIHAWVNLSQSFKMEDLLKDLVQQLYSVIGKPVPEAVGMMNIDKVKELIKNLLQRSRYLIVLDDVWHVNVWDAVKLAFPNNNHGSRVMLTTRKKDIALYSCAELGKDFHLEFLPKQEAWSLFCRKTFQGNSCPPHLEEVCRRKILKLCGGLPLAIVAISGALATKERSNVEEWNMFCRNFGSEIEGNDILEDMKKVLSLSFNELPYYLKSCLMYLTVFPELHAIEHMRLIRLWIAEGFVKDKDGKTPEEVADGYLKELLNRSLIQVVEKTSDGRVNTCRMHGITREIVDLKSGDQNFATIAKDNNIVWPERVNRLSVINSSQNVSQQHKTTFQLRSLLMFALSDSPNQFSIHDLCTSSGAKLLNVLDLQDAPLEAFPAEILSLYLLKYLSLKNTKVKNIPGSIKKLQYLETLDLKHTHVTELPAEIAELKRLRHLLVYRYDIESYAHFHSRHGFKVAAPIGNMQSLQKLCFIEVDQGSGALMLELGKLTQLRRLGIRKMRKEDGAALCSSIEKMINLRSLSISAIKEDEILDIHHITNPPRYLQQLYLSGCLEKFPQWVKSCNNLVRVFLKWSRLKEDPLVYIQGLPNLRHLEFLQVYVGETLCFKAEGFPSLKVLGLDDLKGLKSMMIEKGAMQGLKKLIIQRCGSLKLVPLGIEHLTKLKKIEFFDMPDELLMALRPNVGKEFRRVQHVPTVYTTYRRDGGWDVYSLETFGERESDSNHSSAKRTLELPTLWKV